jgi:hypothetical protein
LDGRGGSGLLIVGGFELADSPAFIGPQQRSQQAQPGIGVPPEIMVVVAEDEKLFHGGAASPLLHDKTHLRTITVSEARREGYTPCVRCMEKYLNENAALDPDDEGETRQLNGIDFKLTPVGLLLREDASMEGRARRPSSNARLMTR